MAITLCEFCKIGEIPLGTCYVCEGKSALVDKMLSEIKDKIKKYKTYSLSLRLPREWQIKEEIIWDYRSEYKCIKEKLNRKIKEEIKKIGGPQFDKEGEVRVVFDFKEEKVEIEHNDLFLFGRYFKGKKGLSQTRWVCSSCKGKGCKKCNNKGKLYLSVEEVIGEQFKEKSGAEDYIFHASGREDIDATNSAGRPFVLRLKKAKKRDFRLEFEEREGVKVKDLKTVGREKVEVVTESHFDKAYLAWVEFEEEPHLENIREIIGKEIRQRTPRRVLRRRSDIVRKRKIFDIKIKKREERRVLFYIKAEAGTYIKELISGDGGRTTPSISELCGKAVCTDLEVCEIDDEFLRLLGL